MQLVCSCMGRDFSRGPGWGLIFFALSFSDASLGSSLIPYFLSQNHLLIYSPPSPTSLSLFTLLYDPFLHFPAKQGRYQCRIFVLAKSTLRSRSYFESEESHILGIVVEEMVHSHKACLSSQSINWSFFSIVSSSRSHLPTCSLSINALTCAIHWDNLLFRATITMPICTRLLITHHTSSTTSECHTFSLIHLQSLSHLLQYASLYRKLPILTRVNSQRFDTHLVFPTLNRTQKPNRHR